MNNYILMCLLAAFSLLFIRNVLSWAMSMDNYKTHKKRLKQLRFEDGKNRDLEDLLKFICTPADKYIMPELKPYNEPVIKQQLDFIGWNKYFTPKQFVSFKITLKCLSVLLFLLLTTNSVILGIVWGCVLFFGFDFIFDNAMEAKKEKILSYFPDFLIITQGFLDSDIPLAKSIENTIKYVSPEWQTILSNFIVTLRMKGLNVALDEMNSSTGMFEIKQFSSLLRLSIEKGNDVTDGFNAQVKNLTEIQQYILERKVAKRKALAICIQAPMLIAIFVTFGLPIIGDMTSLGLF